METKTDLAADGRTGATPEPASLAKHQPRLPKRRLTPEEVKVEIQNRESWARLIFAGAAALAGLVLAGVLIWKMLHTPDLLAKLDFSDVLSLVLALFSIWLSVSFYYKATEQSNAFYDRVFDFTKDVGVTLGRIEERFGERLTHLGETQSGMQARMDEVFRERLAARAAVDDTQEQLSARAEELEAIKDLAGKQRLTTEEVQSIQARLDTVAGELRRDIDKLAAARHREEQAGAELGDDQRQPSTVPQHARNFLRLHLGEMGARAVRFDGEIVVVSVDQYSNTNGIKNFLRAHGLRFNLIVLNTPEPRPDNG